MDFIRCPCGQLLDCYKDAFDYMMTNTLQLVCKENEIAPHKLQLYINTLDMTDVFGYLGLTSPCCRVHIKNYYDPVKALYGHV